MEIDLNLVADDIEMIKQKHDDIDEAYDEILELLMTVWGVDNKHDYLMLTDINYRRKNRKHNRNSCDNCNSINIANVYGHNTCINCGCVLGCVYTMTFNDMQHYSRVNSMYKRKNYVKTIINDKLYDLSQTNKEKIINESNRIFVEFNRLNLNQRKSFFSYSYMFRYILNELELFDYVDKFKPLKTKHTLAANEAFYNKL